MESQKRISLTLTEKDFLHLFGLLDVSLDFYENDSDEEHKEYRERNKKLYERFKKRKDKIERK